MEQLPIADPRVQIGEHVCPAHTIGLPLRGEIYNRVVKDKHVVALDVIWYLDGSMIEGWVYRAVPIENLAPFMRTD